MKFGARSDGVVDLLKRKSEVSVNVFTIGHPQDKYGVRITIHPIDNSVLSDTGAKKLVLLFHKARADGKRITFESLDPRPATLHHGLWQP